MNAVKFKRCPRCGIPRNLGRFAVCATCAADLGWDPECQACLTEQNSGDATELRHVETCGSVTSCATPLPATAIP